MAIFGKGAGFRALPRSLARADTAINGLERLGSAMERTKAEQFIVRKITILAQEAIMRSLAKSGLKSHSGLLARACRSADVWIAKGKLRIAMRTGWPEKLYTYGSALDCGAVYTKGGHLGEKAKRTLKNLYLTGRAMTKRERVSFEKGVTQRHVGEGGVVRTIKRGAFNIANATVRAPRPFFYVGAADRTRIQKAFRVAYEEYLTQAVRRAA